MACAWTKRSRVHTPIPTRITTSTTTMTTSTSSTTGRNNTLVAESDLQAALDAMDRRLHSIKDRPLVQDWVQRLKQQLDCIAEPISDEAFHVYLQRHLYETNSSSNSTLNEQNDDNEQKEDDDFYHDDDLLDPQALQRVQELRTAAREQAQRVQTIRTQVLEASLALAQRQVQHWTGCTAAATSTESTSSTNEQISQEQQDQLQSEIAQMQASWEQIHQALEQQNQSLPLTSLQQTLAVVQEHIDSKNKNYTSQTEHAIYNRTQPEMMDLQEQRDDTIQPPLPEERLAQFLSN